MVFKAVVTVTLCSTMHKYIQDLFQEKNKDLKPDNIYCGSLSQKARILRKIFLQLVCALPAWKSILRAGILIWPFPPPIYTSVKLWAEVWEGSLHWAEWGVSQGHFRRWLWNLASKILYNAKAYREILNSSRLLSHFLSAVLYCPLAPGREGGDHNRHVLGQMPGTALYCTAPVVTCITLL